MYSNALRIGLLCCTLLLPAFNAEASVPGSSASSAQSSGAAASKKPPKDGNEGTYPTYKGGKKQSGASASGKNAKALKPPKDGNEGTYPTYKGSKKAGGASASGKSAKAAQPAGDGKGAYPTYQGPKKAGGSAASEKSPKPVRTSEEGGADSSAAGGQRRAAEGPAAEPVINAPEFSLPVNQSAGDGSGAFNGAEAAGSGAPAEAAGASPFEAGGSGAFNVGGRDASPAAAPGESLEENADSRRAAETAAPSLNPSVKAEGTAGSPDASADKQRIGSVPFVSKRVAVLTPQEARDLGLPVTKEAVLELYRRRDFTCKTPDYTLNQSRLNVEIAKRGKLRVACDLRQINAKALLLAAFHMPMLPGEEEASRIWLLKTDSTYNIIDMGELDVGVYQFLAVALDESCQPAASPNLQRMMLSYGFKEALLDYKDRQYLLYGDMSKPAAFGDIESADAAAKEVPLFKIVPSTCVLKPGKKVELKAERLLSYEQRRLNRINRRYGNQADNAAAVGSVENGKPKAEKDGKAKPKRFCWSMYGQGKLVPVSDDSAVYYAPNIDNTGAEISCWEEGDDSVVTATIYVTTLPIGEMPGLEQLTLPK